MAKLTHQNKTKQKLLIFDLEDKFRKISPRLEGKGTGDENDGREVITMETD